MPEKQENHESKNKQKHTDRNSSEKDTPDTHVTNKSKRNESSCLEKMQRHDTTADLEKLLEVDLETLVRPFTLLEQGRRPQTHRGLVDSKPLLQHPVHHVLEGQGLGVEVELQLSGLFRVESETPETSEAGGEQGGGERLNIGWGGVCAFMYAHDV